MTAPVRTHLPPERKAITRTFRIKYKHKDGSDDEMHIYITAGVFEDGRLGEVFIKADRMGSLARGALDALGIMISIMLQSGISLETITAKLRHTRYEPSGWTGDPEFRNCTSVLDLVAQWLEARFGKKES